MALRIVTREQLTSACHGAVAKAVRTGRLPPQGSLKCADCGCQAMQYDHRDYRKPLDVEPVCKPCNIRRGKGAPDDPLIVVDWIGPAKTVRFRRGYCNYETRVLHRFDVSGDQPVSGCGIRADWVEFSVRYSLRECRRCFPKRRKL